MLQCYKVRAPAVWPPLPQPRQPQTRVRAAESRQGDAHPQQRQGRPAGERVRGEVSVMCDIQVYYFLTVLRCLWLRDSDKKQWEGVTRLVSNLEHRRGTK